MSREIKFRAWSESNEKYLSHDERWVLAPEDGPEKGYRMNCCEIDWIGLDIWEAEDIVLEQYTGLKDKNGKEIYEGDIIEFTWTEDLHGMDAYYRRPPKRIDDVGQVFESGGEWQIKNDREHISLVDVATEYPNRPYRCKVIGNIHENSELLEDEK